MSDTISLADAISPDDIDAAVAELSAAFGWGYADAYAAVRERAQGERDPASLALAAAGLYQQAVDEGQELALTSQEDHQLDADAEVQRYLALAAPKRSA